MVRPPLTLVDPGDDDSVSTAPDDAPTVVAKAVPAQSKQQQKESARFVRERKANHILETGLAISERKQACGKQLAAASLVDFLQRVDKDPEASLTQKREMLEGQKGLQMTGFRIWKRFKEIKALIKNVYSPLLEDPIEHSGWNWDKSFDVVRQKVWVKEGKDKKVNKEDRKMEDCPKSFEPVEFYTFKKNYTHHLLAAQEGAASKIGTDTNIPGDNLRSKLHSRKQQRREELTREKKKKKATTAQNNSNSASQENTLTAIKGNCYKQATLMSLLSKAHQAGRPGTGELMDQLINKFVLPELRQGVAAAKPSSTATAETTDYESEPEVGEDAMVDLTLAQNQMVDRTPAESEMVDPISAAIQSQTRPAPKAAVCAAGIHHCKRENMRISLGGDSMQCEDCILTSHPSCGELNDYDEFVCFNCKQRMAEEKENEAAAAAEDEAEMEAV
jgi:hypothetical protein